jgi:uncharacterized small protein (DUF1192 family)
MMITKTNALQSLRPGAEWVLRGDDLEWLDTEQTRPTDAEIAAEITRLEADYAAKQYQRDRAAAYPSLAEQMDMQYWDSVNGTTVWADTIAAIKQEYPKP